MASIPLLFSFRRETIMAAVTSPDSQRYPHGLIIRIPLGAVMKSFVSPKMHESYFQCN